MCRLLFVFQTTCINGCKSKLLFKPPATAKLAIIRPLPRGGGLGRGHSPNCSNLSQHTTAQIQALRLVALSLTLSHGERGRVAVGIKGSARKTGCVGCFFAFQTTFINAQFRQPAPYNFQKPNQNQPSATVQAAFPIPVTHAGFLPVHRLFAAKFRDSKNAAR